MKYIWRNIFGEGSLPMKCSEPMLLAKREAPTGIQCMFLQKIFKLKDEIGKETDLEINVTWMQIPKKWFQEKCHLDARKKPVTLPLLLLLAASRPVTFTKFVLNLSAITFPIGFG